MPTAKVRASTILGAFEQAQTELVGKAVILTDGKAGTVENVWLDESRSNLRRARPHKFLRELCYNHIYHRPLHCLSSVLVRPEKLRATTEAAFRDQASPNLIRFILRRSAVDAVTRSPPSGIRSGHCRIAARIRHIKKSAADVIWTLLPQKIGT